MGKQGRSSGLRGRMRRRPLLAGVAVVAVVGAVLVFASGARPGVDVLNAVPLEDGYVGTTYAFDALLCVGSKIAATTITGVEVEQAPGGTTRLLLPPDDSPPTVGFPVEQDAGRPVEGYVVPAGESDCGFRLLVTPDRTGTVEAGTVRLSTSYGPGGLLRRTLSAQADVTLEVTGTGTDPRSAG